MQVNNHCMSSPGLQHRGRHPIDPAILPMPIPIQFHHLFPRHTARGARARPGLWGMNNFSGGGCGFFSRSRRRILSHSMNSHEPAAEERTGSFEGRVGGTELGDIHQVGVHVLRGGGNRLLEARVNGRSYHAAGHHRKATKPMRKPEVLLAGRLAYAAWEDLKEPRPQCEEL